MAMIPSNDLVKAFVAGAILPSIATIWLWNRQRQQQLLSSAGDGYSSEEEEEEEEETEIHKMDDSRQWGMANAPYKMILAVNTDLSMGKGKIAAQCGHAAVGCYRIAHRRVPHAVNAWNVTGCAKIAVKCPEHHFASLTDQCQSKGIPYYIVEDAGRTQIAAGSRTVLAMFAPVAVLSTVTDHLKLL